MKEHRSHYLHFSGLSIGSHTFSYELNDDFFASFQSGEIKRADVKVELNVDKSERILLLRFSFSGYFETYCDRCLKDLDFDVDFIDELVVRFTDNPQEKEYEEGIWWVDERSGSIDLSQYMYELVYLQRPIQYICPDNENGEPTCEKDVLERLRRLQIDENTEQNNGINLPDSAMEALRKLKKEN